MANLSQKEKTYSDLKKTRVKKYVLIFLLIFLSLFFLTVGIVFLATTNLSQKIGLSRNEFTKKIWNGIAHPYSQDYLTVLLLGLDTREDDNSLLTDTILLVSINTQSGDYLLFSIPRDLWLADLKTKINSLYYYGSKENPQDGTILVKNKLEEILSWKIDYVALLKMDQLKELIDDLGGIEVSVERSFVDEKFPKDDGSNELKTISFDQGWQKFDGERALEFIRSRQSEDLTEGTDEARQKRQKKVILALKNKLINEKSLWLDFRLIANLINFATQEIEVSPDIDLATLASFAKLGKELALKGEEKELELDWEGETALLKTEKESTNGAWVLVPKSGNWENIAHYFKESLP
ncbi:MAG: LCP family protein [Candidatus Shapirobacteria bacterium]